MMVTIFTNVFEKNPTMMVTIFTKVDGTQGKIFVFLPIHILLFSC